MIHPCSFRKMIYELTDEAFWGWKNRQVWDHIKLN
jgi:hypothetical protein